MSEGVIWLCSYPRSGNTWLRVFLANWLAGDEAPVALDSLHRYGLAWQDNLPALWERVTGSPRPDEAVQIARAAEVQRALPRWAQATAGVAPVVFCKTHAARALVNGHRTIADDITLGAIQIVRDPRSIARSLATFGAMSTTEAVELMGDPAATLGVAKAAQHVGSWSANVMSWHGVGLTVRYEDLPDGFAAVLEYLRLPRDERLGRALSHSNLAALSEAEARTGFTEARNGRFFGGDHPALEQHLVWRIEADHGAAMRRFGYL